MEVQVNVVEVMRRIDTAMFHGHVQGRYGNVYRIHLQLS